MRIQIASNEREADKDALSLDAIPLLIKVGAENISLGLHRSVAVVAVARTFARLARKCVKSIFYSYSLSNFTRKTLARRVSYISDKAELLLDAAGPRFLSLQNPSCCELHGRTSPSIHQLAAFVNYAPIRFGSTTA